jgi:catechol 2,3-dioxygenase-like lactoylglutathione lyase family enzyme
MAISIQRLDHVAITVSNIEKSRAFYTHLLGLTEVPRPKSFDFPGVWYRLGPIDIHLVGSPPADPPGRHHFCLVVADLHAAAATLQSAGYSLNWDAHKIEGIDRFFTRDPDGNRVELQGPEKKS